MKNMIVLAVLAWTFIGCGVATDDIVDLRPDETGDRISVVKDRTFAYRPVTRANIGDGSCRHIRRASNGDLYVTGPRLRLFRSTDGGFNWTESALDIQNMMMMSSFTILDDDTFLVSYMPPPSHEHKRMFMARSTDPFLFQRT